MSGYENAKAYISSVEDAHEVIENRFKLDFTDMKGPVAGRLLAFADDVETTLDPWGHKIHKGQFF